MTKRGKTSGSAAVLILGMAAVLLLGAPSGWAGEQTPSASSKVRLGVIPFTGPVAGVPEGFGEALGQAIRHGLSQVRAVRPVDSGEILGSSQRLHISLADRLSDEAALRLVKDLQAQGLVTGTYALDGDSLKVQARLADPSGAGQVILGEETMGPLAQFLSAQGRITRQILQAFRVRLTPYDERRLQAAFGEQTGSLEAYALYGRAGWQQGLGTKEGHEQAVALLAKALEADQNFALAHFALGISLQATNNRWKASGEFRKTIQLDGTFADAYKWLGDLLVKSPRRLYDQAVQAFQKALELSPDYAEAMVGLGDARQAKGQFDEAIGDYKRALQLEPENARVHFGLGKIYYNEKQLYHEAVSEYQQAITLDPKYLEAHMSLGEIYEEKGLYQEAIARYNQVLDLDPRHPGATYGLALAYERVDPKKAIEQWERYIDLASTLSTEKDWVDIAKKHLEKLRRGEKVN
ncbi:MAG TPA: tetratricopeptide repeat protein [Candidatus Methylomirabilis sp.]|nr:tetratricopeptide repeat protein [Candidatus Methylomirabilis sp.]